MGQQASPISTNKHTTCQAKSEWVRQKLKLSLCLTKYHAMQMYGGVEV